MSGAMDDSAAGEGAVLVSGASNALVEVVTGSGFGSRSDIGAIEECMAPSAARNACEWSMTASGLWPGSDFGSRSMTAPAGLWTTTSL